MKLYLAIEEKSPTEIFGHIYSSQKHNIWIWFNALAFRKGLWSAEFWLSGNKNHTTKVLFSDCGMSGKNVLYYVDNHFEALMRSLRSVEVSEGRGLANLIREMEK